MVQAFGIFSGGLDSVLSARLIMDQGLTPTLITFVSPFFPPDQARAGARDLGLPLTEVDIYSDLLSLVKNPPHGRGRHLNPCIDCHALMFKKAGEFLPADEPGFLFSGEVVGQRPMSQNPRALKIVAQDSGKWGLVLRPLSAKLMPETEAESLGWVRREDLMGLSGRSRRTQIDLAQKYGLAVPPPAGGCLLTDGGFCRRFQWLLNQPQAAGDVFREPGGRLEPTMDSAGPEPDWGANWPPVRLVEIIKRGRLFSAEPGRLLAVGRNQADNQALADLTGPDDLTFHLEGGPGPTVLLPATGLEPGPASLNLARHLAGAYGDHGRSPTVSIRQQKPGRPPEFFQVETTRPQDWERFLIKGV